MVNVILMGATGNLAQKYLWQSLVNLASEGRKIMVWPAATRSFEVVDPLLRGILAMNVTYPTGLNADTFRKQFVGRYHQLTQPAHFRALHDDIRTQMKEMKSTESGRVFYLSVPPKTFGDIAKQINENCRPADRDEDRPGTPYLKVIVEKPFGTDTQSAENLSREIFASLKDDEALLIDHYCGKVGVANIPIFYKLNPDYATKVMVPKKIKDIIVHMEETEDVKGRTKFYDEVGVIRDTMQNHITMLAQMVAASPPFGSKEKLEVLKAISPNSREILTLAQYADYNAHVLDDLEKEKADHNKDLHHVGGSIIPTYAKVAFTIGKPHRLAGVKIVFVSGKALRERRAFAQVRFKDGETLTFNLQGDVKAGDGTKVSGAGIHATNGLPEFVAAPPSWTLKPQRRWAVAPTNVPNAYQALLNEVLQGRFETFVNIPEVLEAWKLWTPVLHDINKGVVTLKKYQHGGVGLDDDDNNKENEEL